MKTPEKVITQSVGLIMGYMVQHILKICFTVAMEDELSDLKGLIAPDSFCDINKDGFGPLNVELELLDSLVNPLIKTYLSSAEHLGIFISNYQMIHAIEISEIVENESVYDYACESFCSIINMDEIDPYHLCEDLSFQYDYYYMIIWFLAQELILAEDYDEEVATDNYYEMVGQMTLGLIYTEHPVASMLFDLAVNLKQDETGLCD